ncbi:hypothetical protein AAG906_030811 [Vitis piasezkii]
MQAKPQDLVYLADGSALNVVGLGDVQISLPNGSVWLLEKVRHILDLRRNLISVGQLDDEGHAILFVDGTWKVTKGARVLARGKKTGTLYMTSCPRDTIAVVDASTDTSLWHCRLGHMSEKGMKMLLSKGKLPKLKSIDFDMCESCILGKQKKVSFLKTGRTQKAEKLELVHIDLWRPSPVASLGGSRYYITFIDDSSRKNGVAERMNRTLNERARSMSGKEVKFSHLKVFGCVSYVHNDSDARSKLDAKSKICFFIGYGDEKFGYRSTIVLDVTEIDQKKSEFVNFDELTESTVQKGGEEDKENNSSKWELAMNDEMYSLLGNQTWELTELPVGKKALHNKWVYRIKNEHDGSKRYKARLVIKGFQQKKGIDYIEIFSPVVKMSTIRLVQGMTTFFHGDLEEDLYMIQPRGFISLYGLKQAPRQWYKKCDNFMHRIGFKRCEADHCCYVKFFDNSYMILLLYVGDMLIAGSDIEEINNLKKQLSKQFTMKDLGATKQILDADFAGDIDSRKSTIGFVFTLGAIEVGKEMIWLHGFLDELECIFLAKKSTFHSKSKHIQTKYHFIRYLVEDKLVILEKICGSKNPVDMLTKGVTMEKLKLCATSIDQCKIRVHLWRSDAHRNRDNLRDTSIESEDDEEIHMMEINQSWRFRNRDANAAVKKMSYGSKPVSFKSKAMQEGPNVEMTQLSSLFPVPDLKNRTCCCRT